MSELKRHSIGKEKALALASSGWWKSKTAREIAEFQMFTEELSMPFGVFHEALEKALGRPVWTHELGPDWAGLAAELLGERSQPSMQEILDLIPAEKRIVLTKGANGLPPATARQTRNV